MSRRPLNRVLLGLTAVLFLPAPPSRADVPLDKEGKFRFFGDVRVRAAESDWDSMDANGTERTDRTRTRLRLRAGFAATILPNLSAAVRLRSGSADSQQSPHVTIIDWNRNPLGDNEFTLDQWYLKYKTDSYWGSVGRDTFPFWKQNELLWDDDVTITGLAGGWRWKAGDSTIDVTGGGFALPDGMKSNYGNMYAAQGVYGWAHEGLAITAAAGYFDMQGQPLDAAHPAPKFLRNGNGNRDYSIGTVSGQVKIGKNKWPVTAGADVYRNFEDYDDEPAGFTATNRDETDGWVAQAAIGRTSEKNDLQFYYGYAAIRTLAVNASYAVDDWVRWGSATQTDASDLRGHELRATWTMSKAMNLMLRVWVVEAITSVQDGKRARLDWNLKW